MIAHAINTLYQTHTTLLSDYRTAPFGGAQIKATLAFAETLLQQLKQFPDPLVAQLSLPKRHLAIVTNLSFNTALSCALLSIVNKLNDSTAQQLICAAIGQYAYKQKDIELYLRDQSPCPSLASNKRMLMALSKTDQQVWRTGCKIAPVLTRQHWSLDNWPTDYNQTQQMLFIAASLALQLTPITNRRKHNFASALRTLVQACPARWLDLLAPLSHYPSLIPPGTIVRQKPTDKQEQQQPKAQIVLATSSAGKWLIPVRATTSETPATLIAEQQIDKITTMQIGTFSQLDNWWSEQWQQMQQQDQHIITAASHIFRLDRPPPALISIQQRLKQEDIEGKELAQLIGSEPLLANYVLDSAQQASRMKLKSRSVRQGIMMHGFERTSSMLMQYALLQRINQHDFPLQQTLLQFTLLRGHIASLLAQAEGSLLPESISTLACFASAGLFTLSALKTKQHWHLQPKRTFALESTSALPQSKQLNQHCIKISQSWQQPDQHILAIRCHAHKPWQMHHHHSVALMAAILGLSLVAARKMYFSACCDCQETQEYVDNSLKMLKISKYKFEQLQHDCADELHYYCPYPK